MMPKTRMCASSDSFLDRVDCLLEIYKEKIPSNGEDAYVFSANCCAVLIGAFDGCGGAGAKRHAKLQGKTGAYAASRIVSGTVKDWFSNSASNIEQMRDSLKESILQNLQSCYDVVGEASRLVSPMVKVFPTTAAFACCSEENGRLYCDYFWAGDSRVYLWNGDGLFQLSVDDLSVPDAMENLYDDGVMTNLVSKSKDFTIHHGRISLEKPSIVFAATDGCFGYVSSPMEFEYMLADTLMASQSICEWEQKLGERIGAVAGDDYTLSGVVLDFGSFQKIRKAFEDRRNELYENYICLMDGMTREQKTALWQAYKKTYYLYKN